MTIFLNVGGHASVAIMTIFVILAIIAGPIMTLSSNILWSFLTLLQRVAKMQFSCENGTKEYSIYTNLWPKKGSD